MPFTLPLDYPRIQRVNNFQELVTTRFGNGVNALCWERKVEGDFAEVVHRLGPGEAITTVDDARLLALPASSTIHASIPVIRLFFDRPGLRPFCPSVL